MTASRRAVPHPSQTADTLYDLGDVARAAVEAARKRDVERAPPASAAAPAPTAQAVVERSPGLPSWLGWPQLARAVMVVGGGALLVLFALDSPLLPALAGPQLLLSVYYLVGGLVLSVGALLPLPVRLRAALSTVVGAVPLFVAGPLVGGVGGWRGLAAALVILVLPGALLLRARVTTSRLARLLVGGAALLAALIYLVPDDGVVPVQLAFGLLASGSLPGILTGALFLLPLLLTTITLTAVAGGTSTGFGNLWAVLVLVTASGAIVLAGQARDERSMVHLGVALLAAGAAVAVGVSDLLDLDPAGP